MRNIDIIMEFNRGKKAMKVGNLKIVGDVLINYSTIIARRTADGIELNNKYHSRTTSTIQNMIRKNCNVVREYVGD